MAGSRQIRLIAYRWQVSDRIFGVLFPFAKIQAGSIFERRGGGQALFLFMFIGLTRLPHCSPPSLNIAELAFYSALL
jgi:hypothetical protein